MTTANAPDDVGRADEPAESALHAKATPLDVLLVTAVAGEYTAAIDAGGGAAAWEEHDGVAVRAIEGERGSLTIGVTQALRMGAAGATMAAAGLLEKHSVRCLAMCGVCAGKRGDVELGDVIIADKVWQYDAGKAKPDTIVWDTETFQVLPAIWTHPAERFALDPAAQWLATRPRSYETQGNWVLERLYRGVDPMSDPQSEAMCADWKAVLARLRKLGLMDPAARALTPEGRAHIDRVLEDHRGRLPGLKQLRVHVGPIASGSMVIADGQVFARLEQVQRKVLGVEMEAASIGALTWAKQVQFSLVVKAVMDHADPDKSDNFKPFAARASAEVLLAFVRKNLPPRSRPHPGAVSPEPASEEAGSDPEDGAHTQEMPPWMAPLRAQAVALLLNEGQLSELASAILRHEVRAGGLLHAEVEAGTPEEVADRIARALIDAPIGRVLKLCFDIAGEGSSSRPLAENARRFAWHLLPITNAMRDAVAAVRAAGQDSDGHEVPVALDLATLTHAEIAVAGAASRPCAWSPHGKEPEGLLHVPLPVPAHGAFFDKDAKRVKEGVITNLMRRPPPGTTPVPGYDELWEGIAKENPTDADRQVAVEAFIKAGGRYMLVIDRQLSARSAADITRSWHEIARTMGAVFPGLHLVRLKGDIEARRREYDIVPYVMWLRDGKRS